MKKKTSPETNAATTKPVRKIRSVYFTDERWKALQDTGNASHALNKLCDGAGIPEQPITDKTPTQ